MDDLISRQAAIDDLHGKDPSQIWDTADIEVWVNSLPSVQLERKKGHWVEIGDEPYDEWECDVCGFVIDGSGCIDPEEYRDVYKYCPRCGSDMRGEQNE